ncbi:MAG: iron ABC transporter permease [Actinobacteria bacterium]|nr:iron ABC transporter permease [Actinomycetota bacterium]
MNLSTGRLKQIFNSIVFQASIAILCLVLSTIFGYGYVVDPSDPVLRIRLFRGLVAFSAGASLATAGVVFQSVFRNPMAEPYLLGSSSGASFAVAVLTIVSSYLSFSTISFYPAAALFGAAAASFVTLSIARTNGRTPVLKLLLTGIAVSFFLGAMTPVILAFSGKDLYTVFFFMNGTTQGAGLFEALSLLTFSALLCSIIAFNSRSIDYLLLGEERSYHIGFEIEKAKMFLLLIASFLTGLSVAFAGIIGFVGLLIPNLTKSNLSKGAFHWVSTSFFAGGTFLVIADFSARNLFFPREVPLNSITAILGAPYLIYLVRKNA